jgi:hypothetical protein
MGIIPTTETIIPATRANREGFKRSYPGRPSARLV